MGQFTMNQKEGTNAPLLGVTEEVRDFYDQFPYPRPIDGLEKYRRLWQDKKRRCADHHLFWPTRSYRENHSILIAGCGTSQAAKHAIRWPSAQVTGIDISATSVRFTEELKRKYNLDNLHLYQLPIEKVSDLGNSFDQIVCTGVLHHLADPDAGLRALRDMLRPDGAMHLMVYAPYGRAGIYMMQEFCRRVGVNASDEEMRDLITAISALPPGHPLDNLLREAPDFQQDAALADALLNPQDRAYSVPQLFDLIKKGGLEFGRWVRQAPYSSHCGVMANIPQASRIAHLPLAEQYAAIELFRGTMVRHSIIVYRNDSPGSPHVIDFSGETWLEYVPIRMSDTICVHERLPPGAAAVLINRNHTYRDLYMPITHTEKCWFDAIDMKSSIGEIVERTMPSSQKKSQLDIARTFFERLWWYDQIVFDASQNK
jgi:SAM-dependent methyltransferase